MAPANVSFRSIDRDTPSRTAVSFGVQIPGGLPGSVEALVLGIYEIAGRTANESDDQVGPR
jgi:hypothetical protein